VIAPIRIVFDPIGRIGHHQVRLDAAEHALDIRRHEFLSSVAPRLATESMDWRLAAGSTR
jgi:hypothetical protein